TERVPGGHGEELGGVARREDIVPVERKRIEHRAQWLVAHGPALGPPLGAAGGRSRTHGGVLEEPVADRDPRPRKLEPAVRRPAVQIPFSVRIVPEHHDAAPDHPPGYQSYSPGAA